MLCCSVIGLNFLFPVQVCDAVQAAPGGAELLLHVLDQFSVAGASEGPGGPVALFSRLSGVLGPWPQLLRDFAAFLSPAQARRCGLVGPQTS